MRLRLLRMALTLLLLLLFCCVNQFIGSAQPWRQGDTLFNQTDAKGRKQGPWKKYYPNGKLAYRCHFKNGNPVGTTLRYNEYGVMTVKIVYSPAGDIGRATIYDDNGHRIAVGNYLGQQRDSVWTFYNGPVVVSRESYDKGKRSGLSEQYTDQGVLVERRSYLYDKLEGRQQIFFPNGRVQIQWQMHNDLAAGPYFSCYPNGIVMIKGQYAFDLPDGDWIYYDDKAQPTDTLRYRLGILLNPEVLPNQDSLLKAMEANRGRIPEPSAIVPY